MSDWGKTITFAVVAVVLAALAWLVVPEARRPEDFSDEGEAFYAEFDPLDVGSVEVTDYDEDEGGARPFLVEFKDGRWTIPSHEGYAADAKEQLGKTAAVFNGLKKGPIVAGREVDFAELGVEDPLSPTTMGTSGIGKRVRLSARSGQILIDLIVGDSVEGKYGHYYLRKPDSNRTYSCKVDASGISTRFADWVETDLMDVSSYDVKSVTFDNYRIDEVRSRPVAGEVLGLRKRDDGEWTALTFTLAENEEIDKTKVDDATRALADLTLVGVRRKPAGLAAAIEQAKTGEITVQRSAHLAELQQIGFYIVSDAKRKTNLAANEGEVHAAAKDGVTYQLLFGEVVYGEADELSAAPGEEEGDDADDEEKAEHRYLMIMADFDETLIGGKPQQPVEPVKPEEGAGEAEGETEAEEEKKPDPVEYEKAKEKYEKDKERYEEDLKDYEKKVEDGLKKAKELQEKFAEWYYVISADAFQKLHLARADVVKEKEPEEDEEDAEGNEEGDDAEAEGGEAAETPPTELRAGEDEGAEADEVTEEGGDEGAGEPTE